MHPCRTMAFANSKGTALSPVSGLAGFHQQKTTGQPNAKSSCEHVIRIFCWQVGFQNQSNHSGRVPYVLCMGCIWSFSRSIQAENAGGFSQGLKRIKGFESLQAGHTQHQCIPILTDLLRQTRTNHIPEGVKFRLSIVESEKSLCFQLS